MTMARPIALLSLSIWLLAACEQPPVDTTIDAPGASTNIAASQAEADPEIPLEIDEPRPSAMAAPAPEKSSIPTKAESRTSGGESSEALRQRRYQCVAAASAAGTPREEIERTCDVRFSESAQSPRNTGTGEVGARSPEQGGPSIVTNPSWARQVIPEYPERAAARGIDAIATVRLSCALMPSGSLTDCRVVGEDPVGMGFGSAALSAARRSRVTPATVDGAAVGARVEWNVRFRPPPPEPLALPTPE